MYLYIIQYIEYALHYYSLQIGCALLRNINIKSNAIQLKITTIYDTFKLNIIIYQTKTQLLPAPQMF